MQTNKGAKNDYLQHKQMDSARLHDDDAAANKIRLRTVAFTSHLLPPFPFAFELAVAFFRSSNQINNRFHFHHPDGAWDADEPHQQHKAIADCLSDAVAGVLVGFGV